MSASAMRASARSARDNGGRSLPLDGITVVSIEQAVAAPFATRQLADLGARVIKIERPGGGDFARSYDTSVKGMASHFVWLNRTKESVTLDLKHADAPAVLAVCSSARMCSCRTLRQAQPIALGGPSNAALTVPRPGHLQRLGIRLVRALRRQEGVRPDRAERSRHPVGHWNREHAVQGGRLDRRHRSGDVRLFGILTALLARKDTGQGTVVDVSLFDSLGEWMGYPLYYTAYGGAQPERTGASHATIAPYGPFRTRDGAIVVAVHNDQEWARFSADVLRQPHLAGDPRFQSTPLRFENRVAMTAAIEGCLASSPRPRCWNALRRPAIANARVNSVEDFLRHPQLAAADRWREVDSPVGPLKALRPPTRMSGVEPVMGPIPTVGQHSDAVLEELGFDREVIAQWRADSVV
jgi:itaconate CoA-transferase